MQKIAILTAVSIIASYAPEANAAGPDVLAKWIESCLPESAPISAPPLQIASYRRVASATPAGAAFVSSSIEINQPVCEMSGFLKITSLVEDVPKCELNAMSAGVNTPSASEAIAAP